MEKQAKDETFYKQVGPDEWKPVTRQAKDGTIYKKVGTDDWAPMQPKAQQQPEQSFYEQNFDTSRPWYDFKPENLGQGFIQGLNTFDQATAAPVRKYITEQVTGQDMQKAPTGAEQAQMMGASDTTYKESFGVPSHLGGGISPADIYGIGLEIVQDPFALTSLARKGFQKSAKMVEKSGMFGKAKQSVDAGQEQVMQSSADTSAKSSALISGGGLEVEQGGKLFEYKKPQSLDELREWQPTSDKSQLVSHDRLKFIEKNITDIETKPLEYHYKMLKNPKSMKEMKLKFENLPTEDAKKIASYNQQMIYESTAKIDETISKLTPNGSKSLSESGNDFMNAVNDKYKGHKKELGPLFDDLQQRAAAMGQDASHNVVENLAENTKLGKVIQKGEDRRYMLGKNRPKYGLSDKEHKALSGVIDDLNDGMTFKEIQATREYLRKEIDVMNPGATTEISKVRSVLLSQLEEMAGGLGDDVGAVFKKYAINERALDNLEKIIGGKIETLDKIYAANPDNVIKKIFSNANHSEIVRNYIGDDKFNEMVGSYLQSGVARATDGVNGFSPYKFKSWLKTNNQFLEKNVSPKMIERLTGLNDYAELGKKFLGEVNPSGTAASLKEMIEPKGFFQKVKKDGVIGTVTSETAGRISQKMGQRQSIKAVNELLMSEKTAGKTSIKPTVKAKAGKAVDAAGKLAVGRAVARGVTPEKGPEKWKKEGLDKIIKASGNQKLEALRHTKDKSIIKLLMQASSMEKGSKGFKAIMEKLNKKAGNL